MDRLKFECSVLFIRSCSSCEDKPCVTGDRFVAGFAHKVTTNADDDVEAFNAYAEWCKDQVHDDGHQQYTLHLHLSWSTPRWLQLYCTPRQHWWWNTWRQRLQPMPHLSRLKKMASVLSLWQSAEMRSALDVLLWLLWSCTEEVLVGVSL